jgi:hypothetical protein
VPVPRRPASLDARPADAPPTPEFSQEAPPPITPDELRRAIIMNEVLGPPIALRDPSMSL